MIRVFVYGTLRSGGGAEHLVQGVAERRPALLPGHALYGATLPYPFVLPEPGRSVVGEVLVLGAAGAEAVLADLDRYEGPEYRRVEATVSVDGRIVDAYVWVAADPARLPPDEWIPGGDWFDR